VSLVFDRQPIKALEAMTLVSTVNGYQCFAGTFRIHSQGPSMQDEESIRLHLQFARLVVIQTCGKREENGAPSGSVGKMGAQT
jgi:hypothetical protein